MVRQQSVPLQADDVLPLSHHGSVERDKAAGSTIGGRKGTRGIFEDQRPVDCGNPAIPGSGGHAIPSIGGESKRSTTAPMLFKVFQQLTKNETHRTGGCGQKGRLYVEPPAIDFVWVTDKRRNPQEFDQSLVGSSSFSSSVLRERSHSYIHTGKKTKGYHSHSIWR